jgi:copper/silver efflux system protein
MNDSPGNDRDYSLIDRIIRICLENKLAVFILILATLMWGAMVAPFDWRFDLLPRDPVPVDAIPDIGENQQIVFTKWMGRSPEDVEDQITYPLTVSLLGIPGVKTVRSSSMFGFSSIYVIFSDDVDFYWSRSRVLEKLNSLPSGSLPDGVQPALGPDATALGQVFWYTLEGRDEQGNPTGGWDLHELRSVQDWYVRYALMSANGVSEVASVGGFVKEYQVDVDPDAMRRYGVGIEDVVQAVRMSNRDVSARTMEINRVEYFIRGVGFIETLADIENAVIKVHDTVPVTVRQVAHVALGPALRRGVLDKEGTEVVGGVVVVRYGENPLATIHTVKEKIREISPGLPRKVLPDGRTSTVTIVPFYDRTGLILETLDTLNTALTLEILITVLVIIIMMMHITSSLVISGLLPLAVLMSFIAMKVFGIDANIVALSGIAIAIGTMVDMGIVISENILRHLEKADPQESRLEVVFRAASEVGGAVTTAVATTVVSFLPVFAMEAAEGKLFKPLAFTKTFALIASLIVSLLIIPTLSQIFYGGLSGGKRKKYVLAAATVVGGIVIGVLLSRMIGLAVVAVGAYHLLADRAPDAVRVRITQAVNWIAAIVVTVIITRYWLPVGPEAGLMLNLLFVAGIIGGVLGSFHLFHRYYKTMLGWCLRHAATAFLVSGMIILSGTMIWLGFDALFGWLPRVVRTSGPVAAIAHRVPGLGKEFMPPLDEGSFLYMPTTMPHASIGEAADILSKQDIAFTGIHEIESAVGKAGRAETPLDPAPVSMIETIINYMPEYIVDDGGRRRMYRHEDNESDLFRTPDGEPVLAPDGEPYSVQGRYPRDNSGHLIPDPDGRPFRLWRPALDPDINPGRTAWRGIRNPDDIWDEIVRAGRIPGTTSAPKLQPIAARIVMLQSGMRAPMGIKVKGPDLESIERMGLELERLLKEVPAIEPSTVIADRIVGKPYLEIAIDREAISRYGIMLNTVQDVIETAVGGTQITTTVEGRERYPVRIRYLRERRDSPEELENILVKTPGGSQIPLAQLTSIEYVRGPQVIKSEDTFLVGYVLFDKRPGFAEVDVVEMARDYLDGRLADGGFVVPEGTSYSFAGSFENQVRSQKKLAVVLPLALAIIFMILYFQFKSLSTTMIVFSSILFAWAGGFILIWLYGQPWFMDVSFFGTNIRDLFGMHQINLSVAVWVGFLALFGIASDDGVIMATFIKDAFNTRKPRTREEINAAVIEAGVRRVRPCLMTTATTILALIPVLTSTGRGADIMIPMAIPTFGGMFFQVGSLLIVPVLYASISNAKNRWRDIVS